MGRTKRAHASVYVPICRVQVECESIKKSILRRGLIGLAWLCARDSVSCSLACMSTTVWVCLRGESNGVICLHGSRSNQLDAKQTIQRFCLACQKQQQLLRYQLPQAYPHQLTGTR